MICSYEKFKYGFIYVKYANFIKRLKKFLMAIGESAAKSIYY